MDESIGGKVESAINEQPELWRKILHNYNREKMTEILSVLSPWEYRKIVFTGCGASHLLGISAANSFRAITGLPAAAYPATDVLLHPDLVFDPDREHLLIPVSRSGETLETYRATEAFSQNSRGPIVSLSCSEGMPIPEVSDISLTAEGGLESSRISTKSYSGMLFLAYLLTNHLAGGNITAELEKLPKQGDSYLESARETASAWSGAGEADKFVFLGSGLHWGSACQGALLTAEMTQLPAMCYRTTEFIHGPTSIADERTGIIIIMSKGAEWFEEQLLKKIKPLRSRVLVLTRYAEETVPEDYTMFAPPEETHEPLRPILDLLLFQMIALTVARRKGADPEFRKVPLTWDQ